MSGGHWVGIAEIVLTLVLVLGFGFHQLAQLRRLKREREAEERRHDG